MIPPNVDLIIKGIDFKNSESPLKDFAQAWIF